MLADQAKREGIQFLGPNGILSQSKQREEEERKAAEALRKEEEEKKARELEQQKKEEERLKKEEEARLAKEKAQKEEEERKRAQAEAGLVGNHNAPVLVRAPSTRKLGDDGNQLESFFCMVSLIFANRVVSV